MSEISKETPAGADPLEKRVTAILQSRLEMMRDTLSDSHGDWAVKGFVDVWRTVYPMTADTKVLSKVLEVLLTPVFLEAVAGTQLVVEFASHQNHYPDLSVRDQEVRDRRECQVPY